MLNFIDPVRSQTSSMSVDAQAHWTSNGVDHFLNKITMYRLVLYYLAFLFLIAVIFGSLGILPYSPFALLISTLVLLLVCWITNIIFARVFNAPANVESIYITALILALIITPPSFINYLSDFSFLIWVSVWAMASKYIFAIRKKHIFNPVAFAVALTALTIDQSASWWISNLYMMPFVVAGGLLIIRKIRRFDLVVSFFIMAMFSILGFSLLNGSDFIITVQKTLLYSPLLFFAFVMITEPLTTPPNKLSRIFYGVFVGFLFAPAIHIGSINFTPEIALLVGNIFVFFVSPKGRWILKLKEKIQVAPDVYDFLFNIDRKLVFQPGQYLEWTLPHKHPDNRGNRRYFTIASSPTEEKLRFGIKFYSNSSSFKKMLMSMDVGIEIVASQLAGDFVLPKEKKQKLVFIAGGIGITPFRSMIQCLIDQNEKRSIIIFYSNSTIHDIIYENILDKANKQLKIKTIYTLTDSKLIPDSWRGQKGYITEQMIKTEVPDYKERLFYLSGPRSMIIGFEKVLRNIGIIKKQIKTDFFPGI